MTLISDILASRQGLNLISYCLEWRSNIESWAAVNLKIYPTVSPNLITYIYVKYRKLTQKCSIFELLNIVSKVHFRVSARKSPHFMYFYSYRETFKALSSLKQSFSTVSTSSKIPPIHENLVTCLFPDH